MEKSTFPWHKIQFQILVISEELNTWWVQSKPLRLARDFIKSESMKMI